MFGRNDEIAATEDRFDERLDRALRSSHALSNEVIDANDRAAVVAAIVDMHAASPIVIDEGSFHITSADAPTREDQPPSPDAIVMEITLHLQATGATRALFAHRAPVGQMSSSGDNSEFQLSVQVSPGAMLASDELAKLRNQWIVALLTATDAANVEIAKRRAEITAAVERVAGERYDRRRSLVDAATGAGIPLSLTSSTQLQVPLQPQMLTMASATEAAAGGAPEAGLAVAIADDLVDMILAFSNALERMPVTANQLIGEDEESIRDVLLFLLNANWRGAATGESFVGKGKTDILLRWQDRDAFIGECKIWKGSKAFGEGLTQLLERYTVWRATRVAMILFIREKTDITAVIEKARATITAHPRYARTHSTAKLDTFDMRAQRDEKRIVTLNLVPVVVPQ